MGEMAGLSTPEQTTEGLYSQVICEGCGPTFVDHEGNCRYRECLQKHTMETDAPKTVQNLTYEDYSFLVYCLGCAYAQINHVDEGRRKYILTNHERVVPKINGAILAMTKNLPNAMMVGEDHAAKPVTVELVQADVVREGEGTLSVDDMLGRMAQPVVDDFCWLIKQNKLEDARKLVEEHGGVSTQIAQQFVDWAVKDWEQKRGSNPHGE